MLPGLSQIEAFEASPESSKAIPHHLRDKSRSGKISKTSMVKLERHKSQRLQRARKKNQRYSGRTHSKQIRTAEMNFNILKLEMRSPFQPLRMEESRMTSRGFNFIFCVFGVASPAIRSIKNRNAVAHISSTGWTRVVIWCSKYSVS